MSYRPHRERELYEFCGLPPFVIPTEDRLKLDSMSRQVMPGGQADGQDDLAGPDTVDDRASDDA